MALIFVVFDVRGISADGVGAAIAVSDAVRESVAATMAFGVVVEVIGVGGFGAVVVVVMLLGMLLMMLVTI